MDKRPKILVTFDSMKYPNTGLFYFGKSLGEELIRQNGDKAELTFYIDKKQLGFFGDKVNYLIKRKLHKIWFPYKFDLIHFTDQYCRLKPHLTHAKKLLTIHDLNQVHELEEGTKKLKEYVTKTGSYIKNCQYVVAISNFVADDIERVFHTSKQKVKVIYNGADKLYAPENHTPANSPGKPFLFTIGHVSAKKNFHVLPALLQGNEFFLIIAGTETGYVNKIIEEAKKYNCVDRIIITGPISDADKSWYYKNCLAFVFPSLAEGFGLPVIEAMHFGKPVFLSTHTSLPEIGGKNAFYFNTFNAHDMQNVFSKGIIQYQKDHMQVKIISYADTFNWQKTTLQYLTLYNDIV